MKLQGAPKLQGWTTSKCICTGSIQVVNKRMARSGSTVEVVHKGNILNDDSSIKMFNQSTTNWEHIPKRWTITKVLGSDSRNEQYINQ